MEWFAEKQDRAREEPNWIQTTRMFRKIQAPSLRLTLNRNNSACAILAPSSPCSKPTKSSPPSAALISAEKTFRLNEGAAVGVAHLCRNHAGDRAHLRLSSHPGRALDPSQPPVQQLKIPRHSAKLSSARKSSTGKPTNHGIRQTR